MTQDFGQKSEEIRKYHEEQAMVFSQIQELVGHPGEVVNKAHLYDHFDGVRGSIFHRQMLPILVKYSRTMNNLLKEI